MTQNTAAKSRRLSDYPFRLDYRTRWNDNDMYGHVNNSIYFFLADSVINAFLASRAGHRPSPSSGAGPSGQIGLVAHSSCTFLAPLAYPAVAALGLAVRHVGRSSVRYEVGVFERDEAGGSGDSSSDRSERQSRNGPCAVVEMVHVFVDRATMRPGAAGMGDRIREALEAIVVAPPVGEGGAGVGPRL